MEDARRWASAGSGRRPSRADPPSSTVCRPAERHIPVVLASYRTPTSGPRSAAWRGRLPRPVPAPDAEPPPKASRPCTGRRATSQGPIPLTLALPSGRRDRRRLAPGGARGVQRQRLWADDGDLPPRRRRPPWRPI